MIVVECMAKWSKSPSIQLVVGLVSGASPINFSYSVEKEVCSHYAPG